MHSCITGLGAQAYVIKFMFAIVRTVQHRMLIMALNYIPSNSVSEDRSYTPSIDSWAIRLMAEI